MDAEFKDFTKNEVPALTLEPDLTETAQLVVA